MERNIEEMSLTEKLVHTTVRIETEYKNGDQGVGTGFFFEFFHNDEYSVPVVITNKHVLENAKVGVFYITHGSTEKGPEYGKFSPVVLENIQDIWIPHPNDIIDLGAIPIAPILKKARDDNISIFRLPLTMDHVPSDEDWKKLSVSDEILMIGYPNGIWDSQNNLPIVRTGITATPPYIKLSEQARIYD